MKNFGPASFGDYNAAEYDEPINLPPPEDTEAAITKLAQLAGSGPVLEFAIGTGRIGLPLAQKGLVVKGIEASQKMVEKLYTKPGGDALEVTIGNMTNTRVEGQFSLTYLVFNTLFNLTHQAEQVQCFQNAADHLLEAGRFVIEAYVPDPAEYDHGLRTVHVDDNTVILEACEHNVIDQTVDYQYTRLTNEGNRLTPLPVRYAWPNEIDLMAQLAGMTLESRWADWYGSPFTNSSRSHVSVYKKS